MQVVLLQILLWILRIILFLLLLVMVLIAVVMLVPIRYQVEGNLHQKKPCAWGRVTWFFYLINMKFKYEEEFHMDVRVFGFKVYDSSKEVYCKKEPLVEDTIIVDKRKKKIDISKSTFNKKENKKSFDEKVEELKIKISSIVQKVKELWKKIQDGKIKAEHYFELWNKKETQVTFQRAKNKLGKVIKAIMPKKWYICGDVGLKDPSITGKMMGALGAMYPIVGNNVLIIPDFENEILELKGKAKGKIRLGNLVYQIISLLLNRYCFKFIKLVLDELGGSKKRKKEI